MQKDWAEIKLEGSSHYKEADGEVEPIDLYYSGGLLHSWVVASIIKCAYRNRNKRPDPTDMSKIRHYTRMMNFIAKWGPTPVAATPPRPPDA